MTKPIRIQLSRRKGWRLAEAAGNGLTSVKVDRTTKWGNPYVVDPPISAGQPHAVLVKHGRNIEPAGLFKAATEAVSFAVEQFHRWAYLQTQNEFRNLVRRELGGRNLACWCPLPAPGEPDCCHAAVLLEIANAEPPELCGILVEDTGPHGIDRTIEKATQP